ncbi:MAG: S8 family serine peptidase [Verrucomicrobiae bacterium]|nr:S8 family serine peptidase [Verrucomicrobiae bacterium]
MCKKTLTLASAALLALIIWFLAESETSYPAEVTKAPDRGTRNVEPSTDSHSGLTVASTQRPIESNESQSNLRWLDPFILRVLNSETKWNDSGTQKTVVSIVEADFHHPWLRIEETYSVDLSTREERLIRYVPSIADRVLIKPQVGVTAEALERLTRRYSLMVDSSLLDGKVLKLRFEDFSLSWSLPALINSLERELAIVEIAEPDFLVHSSRRVPSDPLFNQQAGLDRPPLEDQSNRDIDAPEGWAIRTDASSIKVAIIDSGILVEHEDLKNNLWKNPRESKNGRDDDNNGIIDDLHGADFINKTGNLSDEDGHGTFVAGIIGAEGNNEKGIAGVAWDIQLMALRFLDKTGKGTVSDAIACIEYAVKQKVDIINNSWGGSGYSALLEESLKKASDVGIIIVSAAGNDGNRLSDVPVFPAAYSIPNQVVVGSSDAWDQLSVFSNYDAQLVHILAPEKAVSTSIDGTSAYGDGVGTSISAPYVSGTLALLKAEFPGFTAAKLIERLLTSTEGREYLDRVCLSKGRLNLNRAFTGASNNPENDAFSKAEVLEEGTGEITASLTFATVEENEPQPVGGFDGKSLWYRWTSSGEETATLEMSPFNFRGVVAVYTGPSLNQLSLIGQSSATSSGESAVVNFATEAGTTYFIQVGRRSGLGSFFDIEIAVAPPNDLIAKAGLLTGAPFEITGSVSLATSEANEPQIHPSGAGNSVWYRWEAPMDGNFFLIAESPRKQMFARAFLGDPSEENALQATLDRGRPNRFLISVTQGNTYTIGVDSQSVAGGDFLLTGEYLQSPRITVQPTDTVGRSGGLATFNVGVLGIGEASFQWYFEGVAITGANQSFLRLNNIDESDVGSYHVIIQLNGFVISSDSAKLSLTEDNLIILNHPQSEVILEGTSHQLSVFAEPSELISYQWYKSGIPLLDETHSSLNISSASAGDSGTYDVEIKLANQRVRSKKASIVVTRESEYLSSLAWPDSEFGGPESYKLQKAGDYVFVFGGSESSGEGLGFSKDGKYWTYLSLPGLGDLRNVVFGKDLYLVSASSGVHWSTDLIHWEFTDLGTAQIKKILFANDTFLGISSYPHQVIRSTDGVQWSQESSPADENPWSIVWNGETFLLVTIKSNLFSSADGLSWSKVGNSNQTVSEELYYDGSTYWWDFSDSLFKSPNALNWTRVDFPDGWSADFSFDPQTGKKYIATVSDLWEYADGQWQWIQKIPFNTISDFLIFDQKVFAIIDGIPGLLEDIQNNHLRKERLEDPLFHNGKFFAESGGRGYASTDGTNWTLDRTDVSFLKGFYTSNGDNIHVRIQDLQILRSTDLQNWEVVQTMPSNTSQTLFFGGGKFVYSDWESVWSSNDGSSWTRHEELIPWHMERVVYGNDRFIGANGNRLFISENGLQWREIAHPPLLEGPSRGSLTDLNYYDGFFYLVFRGSIFRSSTGDTWELLNDEARGFGADKLVFGNNRMVLFTNLGPAVWTVGELPAVPPVVSVSGHTSGSWVNIGETVRFDVRAFSDTSAIEKIEVSSGSNLITTIVPPNSTFDYRVQSTGYQLLNFEATDANGMKVSKQLSVRGTRNMLTHFPWGTPAINDATFFKGAYYGAGPSGVIFQSINGTDWTNIQTPCANELMRFYANEIGICVISIEREILYSPNGINWKIIEGITGNWFEKPIQTSVLAIPNGLNAYLTLNGSDWYSMATGNLIVGNPYAAIPDLPYEYIRSSVVSLGTIGKPRILLPRIEGREVEGETIHFADTIFNVTNRVLYKLNNDSWEVITPPDSVGGEAVALQVAGDLAFLLTGDYWRPTLTHFSRDGITWERIQGPQISGSIAFREGSFFCMDYENFYRSTNGVEWEILSPAPFPGPEYHYNFEIVPSPLGILVYQSERSNFSKVAFSTDGTTWTTNDVQSNQTFNNLQGAGNNIYAWSRDEVFRFHEGEDWIYQDWYLTGAPVWGNGFFLNRDHSSGSFMTSSDLQNWTIHPRPEWIGVIPDRVLYDGDKSIWILDMASSLLANTEDGINWQQRAYPGDFQKIIDFKGKLYAEKYISTDHGETWTNTSPESYRTWIASTENNLIAIHQDSSGGIQQARLTDGNEWTDITLPAEGGLASSPEAFYLFTNPWIYSSTDGMNWQPYARESLSSQGIPIADKKPFILHNETIREISNTDLSIVDLISDKGEKGVGDTIQVTVALMNLGEETITTTRDVSVELLLSQQSNAWGISPGGEAILESMVINPMQLPVNGTRMVSGTITIPESILPGDYFLSAHIASNSFPRDPINHNDFWISHQVDITIPERELKLEVTGEGFIRSNRSLTDIPHKHPIELIPVPSFGYEFANWTGNIDTSSGIVTFTMESDKNVQAHFEPRRFNVSVGILGGGTVSGLPPSGYSNFGDTLNLEAEDTEHWEFLGWSGDRTTKVPGINLTVGRDLKLTAKFGQSIDQWITQRYTESEIFDPSVGGLLGEPDRNGFTNLQEFLFGIDGANGQPPHFEIFRDGDDVCLIYPRSLTTTGNAYLEARYSTNLADWQTDRLVETVIREEDSVEYVEVRKNSPGPGPLFFEIRAVSE